MSSISAALSAGPIDLAPALPRRRAVARSVWRAAVWGFAGAIAAMAAFAGMFVFVNARLIEVHLLGAHVTGLLAVTALVSAYAGGLDRRAKRQTLGLLGLLLVQGTLVYLKVVSPWIAALHPANAMLLFWAALSVARGSAAAVDRAEGASSPLPLRGARSRPLVPEPA